MNISILSMTVIFYFSCFVRAEDIPRCYCDMPIEERTACPAGAFISRENCLRNHCCYSDSTESGSGVPSCYERKASCVNERCQVERAERKNCGGWLPSKLRCERLNCCYDRRRYPYCFYGNENANVTQQQGTKSMESLSVGVVEPTIDNAPEGPNITFFNPDTATLTSIECKATLKVRCGGRFETRDTCLSRGCCWDSTSKCYQPSETIIQTPRDDISVMVTQMEELMGIDSELNSDIANREAIYEKYSVIIECVNIDVAGVSSEICLANNRFECLDSSCCWNGTSCLRPIPRSSENIQDIVIPNVMKADKAPRSKHQRAKFVSVNVHESVANKQLTCESTHSEVVCGYLGIVRESCLDMGCCWTPQREFSQMKNTYCSLPSLVDIVPIEPVNNKIEKFQNSWSPWGSWSACYVTAPCSNTAERVRWRQCLSNGYAEAHTVFSPGCKLQSEESDKIQCTQPTECMYTYWSPWGAWTSCTRRGLQIRQRECVKDYSLVNGNSLCEAADAAFSDFIAESEVRKC